MKLCSFIILIFTFTLAACDQGDKAQIYHAKIGEHDVYIPREYVRFGTTSIGTEAALLQTWYPGGAIVPGKLEDLWKKGENWKSVRVLINDLILDQSFDEFSKKSTPIFNATELVENQYGLVHMTQPQGKVKDHWDIWYEKEDGKNISYITCTEKITQTSVPQCMHNFFMSPGFSVTITYDKKLLPEWKTIQANVKSMVDSFRDPETSKESILERLQERNHHRLKD